MTRTTSLETAVRQYTERKADLREGAAVAGVTYNRFLQELEKRNVAILENDRFLERLTELAEMFGDESLKDVVNQTILESH